MKSSGIWFVVFGVNCLEGEDSLKSFILARFYRRIVVGEVTTAF